MSEFDPIIAKHRRDVFLYILLPLLITGLLITGLVIGGGVLVAQDILTITQVRTTASVLLIIFVLIPAILLIAVIDFAIIMLAWGNGKIPHYLVPVLRWVRRLLLKMADYIERGADMAAEPIIIIKRTLVQVSTFLDGLAHWFEETTPPENEDAETSGT